MNSALLNCRFIFPVTHYLILGENEGILYLIFLSMVSYVSLSNKDSGINGEEKTTAIMKHLLHISK